MQGSSKKYSDSQLGRFAGLSKVGGVVGYPSLQQGLVGVLFSTSTIHDTTVYQLYSDTVYRVTDTVYRHCTLQSARTYRNSEFPYSTDTRVIEVLVWLRSHA